MFFKLKWQHLDFILKSKLNIYLSVLIWKSQQQKSFFQHYGTTTTLLYTKYLLEHAPNTLQIIDWKLLVIKILSNTLCFVVPFSNLLLAYIVHSWKACHLNMFLFFVVFLDDKNKTSCCFKNQILNLIKTYNCKFPILLSPPTTFFGGMYCERFTYALIVFKE